jgi:hypothetical protein
MSDHHASEQRLFDSSVSELAETQPAQKQKRDSFGPRLPVNTPNSPPRTFAMASSSGNGKGKGSVSTGGGSAIGLPGFSMDPENRHQFVKKDGENELRVDVFANVFKDANLGVVEFEKILNYLENLGKLDFSSFIEGIVYQGFDREFYIRSSLKRVSVSVFCRFAILGAVRGSNFEKIKDSCLDMPSDLSQLVSSGQVIKTAKRRDDMTILRFTASIPHWVAFWLFSVNMEKKIPSEDCPGWLQFPGAASLPMGKQVRLQHISFCKAFSALLPGGAFKGTIYYTAYKNAIPIRDVPSILKEHLGLTESGAGQTEISSQEVYENVSMAVARK